jgi:hypothetical protein
VYRHLAQERGDVCFDALIVRMNVLFVHMHTLQSSHIHIYTCIYTQEKTTAFFNTVPHTHTHTHTQTQENTDNPLYPEPSLSFATGSALYTHYAGDEVELHVHAMSTFTRFGTYSWPATRQEPGKFFLIDIRGPPGVKSIRIVPEKNPK